MTRATLVAATLCVFAHTGLAIAEPASKPADAAPVQVAAAPSAPIASAVPTASATASVAEPTKVDPAVDAKPTPPPPPPVTLVATVDLSTQRLTVTENGKAKFSWAISSGTREFATPAGKFRPQWTAKLWHSRKYDMAPMPHAVFFNGGVAVHATQAIGSLGRPASHGCVRLAPANAATFYGLVQRHGLVHTRINVVGAPRFQKPNTDAIAARRQTTPVRYAAAYPSSGPSAFYSGPAPVTYRPVRYAPAAYRY